MSSSLKYSACPVGTAELRSVLEGVLIEYFNEPKRIVRLERCAAAYRTSFALEELRIWLDDGTSIRLMFKDLSRRAMHPDARRVKPAFLYDPLREIETYRTILKPSGLGTPECYGGVVDPSLDRYWLFLEYVPACTLYEVDAAGWSRAARWLAELHARFAQAPDLLRRARAAHLLCYASDFYRRWARRALAFATRDERRQPIGTRRAFERLVERYESVVERLVALPLTLIHGEFSASNVLVQNGAQRDRVCPVDWEMAAVGPGLVDLAALTAGSWTPWQREALVRAYLSALPETASRLPDLNESLDALDCCRLHLAMQWLGWSSDWSAPPEHAQDWLGEALRLGETLGLLR